MAKAYALERYAFGRVIASYQAIKHKLADMYVKNELARSNAYYGGWALGTDAAELPLAASAARVAASDAFWFASKENIQTHGGMGFTWEVDCHLYYRRARNSSASSPGGSPRSGKNGWSASSNVATRPDRRERLWISTTAPTKPPTAKKSAPGSPPTPRRKAPPVTARRWRRKATTPR